LTDVVKLADMMRKASIIIFFGGAGVSTESGIPDFRSADGLFHQQQAIPPEEILSHDFFMKQPLVFYQYYRKNLLAPDALPNAAHTTLAQLERMGKVRCVITQNIDGLHQQAGSKTVLELHGSTQRNYCLSCGKVYSLEYILNCSPLPLCSCGGLIRPDVVLYGEELDQCIIQDAVRQIQSSDLLIIGGTSLSVYPAAGFARLCQGSLAIINRDSTPMDSQADLVIHGPIGQTLKAVLEIICHSDI
jgi:NAD-dependent deacetylase